MKKTLKKNIAAGKINDTRGRNKPEKIGEKREAQKILDDNQSKQTKKYLRKKTPINRRGK